MSKIKSTPKKTTRNHVIVNPDSKAAYFINFIKLYFTNYFLTKLLIKFWEKSFFSRTYKNDKYFIFTFPKLRKMFVLFVFSLNEREVI